MSENIFGHTSRKLLQSRYQITRQLSKTPNTGRRTLLALDLQTEKQVVIKILTFNNDLRWEDVKLFEREAQTLKGLAHPAIPRYLDYFEFDSSSGKGFALVQTYIKAKSLQEHLERGRTFSENEVKRLAKSLLEVLTYLHHRQPSVIHRDIKPSNILLTNRSGNSPGDVYLVDFGAVQTAVREGSTRTVVGTYGYMPSEQFGGRATPASDLYSLGATLIYLLTRKHPADLLEDELQIEFKQFCDVSSDFAAWLKWMTQPSLSRRLNSAQAAIQALETLSVGSFYQSNKVSTKNHQSSVVKKTAGSEILLVKNAFSLEIILPKLSLSLQSNLDTLIFGFFLCIWLLFYLLVLFMLSVHLPGLLFILVFLILMPLSSLVLVCGVLKAVYLCQVRIQKHQKTILSINQEKITLIHKLYGIAIKYIQSSRQEICMLVCNANSYKLIDSNRKEGTKAMPAELTIWAGNTEFKLSSMTQLERDWLVQELSDWLGLPITREKGLNN